MFVSQIVRAEKKVHDMSRPRMFVWMAHFAAHAPPGAKGESGLDVQADDVLIVDAVEGRRAGCER